MELLTDMDRVRLIAALGRWVLTAREIDPESQGLLLRLSDPDTRLWVEKRAVERENSGSGRDVVTGPPVHPSADDLNLHHSRSSRSMGVWSTESVREVSGT